MLYLEIDRKPLLLPATASATVEHVNPLFADGLEDSFSLPFDLPAEGNEEVLQHVHQLPLRNRAKEFRNARLGYDGQPMYPGILHVLATTERTVRTTFLLEAIVARLGDLTVPEALADERIDLLDELLNQSISLHLRPSYRAGGKCQFPMFLAPDLYDGTNEHWESDATDYDPDRAYGLNDEVRFAMPAAVHRVEVWQCIDAGGAAAGQTPETHPLKWRKLQYGLVNAWDRYNNQHYVNTSGANFYSWCPWFYLKWVLQKSLQKIGYTLKGEWLDDTRWDEYLLANLTTIDAASVPVSEQGFAARQTSAVAYNPILGHTVYRLPAQDETTAPMGDTEAMWNNSTFQWTCPVAGTWRFRVQVSMNRLVPSQLGGTSIPLYRYVLQLRDAATGAVRAEVGRFLPIGTTDATQTLELSVPLVSGDVGQGFYLTAIQGSETNVKWPTLASDSYGDVIIRAWLEEAVPTLMVQDTEVTVSRHMPEVTVRELLIAAIDLWNLEPIADETNRVLRLDYRQHSLTRAVREQTDQSARLIGETEVDLQRRVKGVRLKHDLDDLVPTGDLPEVVDLSYTEQDMPPAFTTNQRRVCMATRRLYTSVFRSGSFVWEPTGYHVQPVLIGESDGAQEVVPELKPLHMVELTKDLKEYIVPVVPGSGTSAWFNVTTSLDSLYLCEFKKQRSSDGTVTDVPGARSWGHGWDIDDNSGNTLLWNENELDIQGVYQRHWQHWLDFLTNAEPVTMDLLVDTPFLRGPEWRRVMNIHGQRYLVERMPVEYGPTTGALVSRGAYAYRWMPSVLDSSLPPEPPAFVCEGEGYGSFRALVSTQLSVDTDTGWVTIRKASTGTTTTFGTGMPGNVTVEVDEPTVVCMWASDEGGNLSGNITSIISIDPNVADLVITGYNALYSAQIYDFASNLTDFDLSNSTNLLELSLIGFGGAELDLTNSPQLVYIDVNGSGGLETVSLHPSALLFTANFQNCALNQASVDEVVDRCDLASSYPGRYVYLDGPGMATPSPTQVTKLNDLAMAGWTVLYNP